ncbi:MAG: ABC transporter ATP-binding protein [Deltaproteobacteria bacterium]|nr:ABC transporter ATP-binding protein [Deltaproteobacteria bacterium]
MSRNYTDLILYRRLLEQARPFWAHLAGIFLLSLFATPLSLLVPLPLKIAVDNVVGSQPLPEFLGEILPATVSESKAAVLLLAAGLVIAVALLMHVQGLATWLLQTYTGEKVVLSLRAQLFRHVQRLSLSYHEKKGTADSIYRIQYDASSIQHILINGVIPFLTAVITVAMMIYITTLLDWQLALIALTVSPVLILVTRACSRQLRSGWFEVKELESTAMSVVQEALTAARVVKAFGREDHESTRFVRHASRSMWGQLRLAFIEGGTDLLVGLTVALGTATALFIGVRHVQSGVLTLGELLIVMTYLAQLYDPLKTISKKVSDLQSALAGAERTFGLLDQAPDVVERRDARSIVRAQGAVAFRNVSFGYEPARLVLRDISFQVMPGTHVGIVGTTGAGKTTLMSLLTRFYDPTSGQILLDGVDLRDYKVADLRNQFAIVLQEPVLFSTSIAENIAYADPNASQEKIIEATKAANAHDFIRRLPAGYETQVGERGMALSGGERQRISLARAFLKDAPILILDEPTSSVDANTEAGILDAMERLIRGRTAFIIAHRPSALRLCQVILRIESGRLIENAPPGEKELVAPALSRDFAVGE